MHITQPCTKHTRHIDILFLYNIFISYAIESLGLFENDFLDCGMLPGEIAPTTMSPQYLTAPAFWLPVFARPVDSNAVSQGIRPEGKSHLPCKAHHSLFPLSRAKRTSPWRYWSVGPNYFGFVDLTKDHIRSEQMSWLNYPPLWSKCDHEEICLAESKAAETLVGLGKASWLCE